MGRISSLARAWRAEESKKPAVRLSRDIQRFYATHPVAPWQKQRIQEIRDDYQEKQQGLDVAHNIASSKLSEEYMRFELEYLQVSHRMRQDGDGHEPFHHDLRALWSPAFYAWIGRELAKTQTWGWVLFYRTRLLTRWRRAVKTIFVHG